MISPRDVINIPQLDTKHWSSVCALTLTLKQGRREGCTWAHIDEYQAKTTFQVFMKKLSKAVYGRAARRHGKKLRVIPVFEKKPQGRWHIHAAIEPPAHLDPIRLKDLISVLWSKMHWGYDRIDFKFGADRGWIKYMLKKRQKSDLEVWFDCIDLESLHNPIAGTL